MYPATFREGRQDKAKSKKRQADSAQSVLHELNLYLEMKLLPVNKHDT